MALTPGTLPTNTLFPGSPQGLLNLFAGYLSAPPSKKTVFIQPTSSGVPNDGSAVWLDTSTNTLKVYLGTSWSAVAVAPGAITPTMVSSGGPSWDTSGNLTATGDITGSNIHGTNATLSSAVNAVQGNFSGTLTAPTIGTAGTSVFYGDGSHLTLPATAPGVPAGTIIYSLSQSVPGGGYLPCTGQTNLNRLTYSSLFAATCIPANDLYTGNANANPGTPIWPGNSSSTFGLPDLRGYFLRSYGTNSDATTTATFGTLQSDAFQGHFHDNDISGSSNGITGVGNRTYSNVGYTGGYGAYASAYGTGSAGVTIYGGVKDPSSDGTHGTPRVSSETRPKNIPVYSYIKY